MSSNDGSSWLFFLSQIIDVSAEKIGKTVRKNLW